jgi:NTE family protein
MGSLRTWLGGAVERIREFAYAQPDAVQLRSQRPRIGLALGGGFARGIAHLGVFKVFQENNIPIDCLAGTSVGALVAAAFASGVPLEKMERQAAMTHFKDFARWTVSWMGLATNERLEGYLRRFAPVSRFDELKIPLTIVATDLRCGEPVYFTEGLVGPALRASCAYPGLFLPVEYQGRLLVDGFLVAPVPVDAVRRMGAEFVIAVHLEGGGDAPLKSVTDVIGRSFSIAQRCAQQQWRGQADVVIEPAVKRFLWDDFEKSPEMIAAGAAAARAALPRIRAALAQPQALSTVRSPAYR